ncbi:MAG TPA: hypothetical protein PKC14_04770 [Candidatus Absconditabacterales bacterium]|nr:hypothetical protein [Candidatus Absconditabacterales bacterium]
MSFANRSLNTAGVAVRGALGSPIHTVKEAGVLVAERTKGVGQAISQSANAIWDNLSAPWTSSLAGEKWYHKAWKRPFNILMSVPKTVVAGVEGVARTSWEALKVVPGSFRVLGNGVQNLGKSLSWFGNKESPKSFSYEKTTHTGPDAPWMTGNKWQVGVSSGSGSSSSAELAAKDARIAELEAKLAASSSATP